MEDLNDNFVLPLHRALNARAAGDETLVTDSENGEVHFLNAAAALVWECCDGKNTLADCVRQLRAAFAIPSEADVAADVRAIVAGFGQKGLLEKAKANG